MLALTCCGWSPQQGFAGEAAPSEVAPLAFDPVLAETLGADDFGMRRYVMALLKAGPNRDLAPNQAQALQAAHMANIGKMAAEGHLLLAGPFLDGGELRGIYVFNVATVAEAAALTNTDPAVVAGSLVMELHPWYGSAALLQVNATHARIARQSP